MSRGTGTSATGVLLSCVLTIGCSTSASSSPRDHAALLAEYQKIADQAAALAETKPSTDASATAQMNSLKKKVVELMYKKVTLSKQETPQQAQQYDAVSAEFQVAIHAFCPTCPGRK